MNTTPAPPPNDAENPAPRLWDPDLLGLAALPLTPIFGSLLLAKNWMALNEAQEARIAGRWMVASLLILLPSLEVPGVYVTYFIAWYFAALRKQLSYVRIRHGGRYRRRSWVLPLAVGIGIIAVFVAAIAFLAIQLDGRQARSREGDAGAKTNIPLVRPTPSSAS